jgi:single-strand DNA-binding protein
MNKVILTGRLGKDPETSIVNGVVITKCRIATHEKFNGTEKTIWHNVVMFNKGKIAQYLKKGRLILVEGRIEYNEYEKDGIRRIYPSIVANRIQLLDGKKSSEVEINTIDETTIEEPF